MILVDTSVWVDHLRSGDETLVALLETNQVLMHPFILGELACGNLRRRKEVLTLLGHLPRITVARNEEVFPFIERHRLMGKGIGFVDAHLLAAVALECGARLWTRDTRLHAQARRMKLAFDPAQK